MFTSRPKGSEISPRVLRASIMCFAVFIAQSAPLLAQSIDVVPADLNLGTTEKTAVAPSLLTSPVAIRSGNAIQQVSAGAALTPAQALAVAQVLATGTQSLILGARGNAVGGTTMLHEAQGLSSLSVPRGVTIIHDFATLPDLSLTGNLTNSGRLVGISTDVAVVNATLGAQNIANTLNALITTALPADLLNHFPDAISNLALTVTSQNRIVNAGTISSAADLNVLSALGRSLIVDNRGGILQAGGDVNFHLLNNTSAQTLRITGGDIVGNNVNVEAGIGTANIHANSIDGVLNINAGCATAGSASGDLIVGSINISGDPTIYSNSNLVLSSSIAVQERLNLVAAGNIVTVGALTLTARGTDPGPNLGKGFDIIIIAGAKFVVNPINAPQGPPGIGPTDTVTVTGASADGGNIVMSSASVSSASTAAGFNGGNILIAAYRGSGGIGLGNMLLGNFDTSAVDGKAGNVTIITPGAVSFNDVTMQGTTGVPSFTITGAQPKGTLVARGDGSVSGTLTPSATLSSTSAITSDGNITAPGGVVNWKVGNGINMSGMGTLDVSALPTGLSAGSVTMFSGNSMTLGGTILANGRDGVNGVIGTSTKPGTAGSAGISGGKVTLTAIGDILDGAVMTIQADGGSGGDGGLGASGAAQQLNGTAGGAGGNGGNGGTLTVAGRNVALTNLSVALDAGAGGSGRDGGLGIAGVSGGKGGAGGTGGNGGKGGVVTLKASQTLTTPLSTTITGGIAGDGGLGRNGGAGSTGTGGAGGKGGNGGAGGAGGSFTATAGNIVLGGDIFALGRGGGDADAGGIGNSAGTGGAGGASGNGGKGGAGGLITFKGSSILYGSFTEFTVRGGDGGRTIQGGAGGTGNNGTGGAGGNSGNTGVAGNGGTVKLTATAGDIRETQPNTALSIVANGGDGNFPGPAGTGGNGLAKGGVGGKGGLGSVGGKGGVIVLSAVNGSLSTGNDSIGGLVARGGESEIAGNGGSGGSATSAIAGAGGNGGPGGSGRVGGAGGSITIVGRSVNLRGLPALDVSGNEGGDAGNGGSGGTGVSSGGNGASAGQGATGGVGGKISITSLAGDIFSDEIRAEGGIAGFGNVGGTGANSSAGTGGNGGAGGRAGQGGKGGTITATANGNMTFDQLLIVNGGSGGLNGGGRLAGIGRTRGGNGGSGATGATAGLGGAAGIITLTATEDIRAANMRAVGGAGIVGNGDGGLGGSISGSSGGIGGNGGNAASGSGGGKGGVISITAGGDILSNSGLIIHVSGGDGGAAEGKGGNGGGAGFTSGVGGAGGAGSIGGAGGASGSIKLVSKFGDVSAGVLLARGGNSTGSPTVDDPANPDGGNGGLARTGGNGGNSGRGNNGGKSGSITISGGLVTIGNTSVRGGTGGSGLFRGGDGANSGTTGSGGNGGIGFGSGNGGDAGSVTVTARTGITTPGIAQIDASGGAGGNLIGDAKFPGGGAGGTGGTAGNGGNGGNALASGRGGKAGTITFTALSGDVNITGTLTVSGGFGGDTEARGGAGGTTTGSIGGRGGSVAAAGAGLSGGAIKLTARQGSVSSDNLSISGGNAGDNGFSRPGDGGGGVDVGGNAGNFAVGGAGGNAGSLTVSSAGTATLQIMLGGGGNAGTLPTSTATGGPGLRAGSGSNGGGGANGGNGGTITIIAPGLITLNDEINLDGGNPKSGTPGGAGGVPGTNDQSLGGNGGNGGFGGKGGNGGKITATSTGGNIVLNGAIDADGGFPSSGGNGGIGGNTAVGVGGNGGAGGKGGSGGSGGVVTLRSPVGSVALNAVITANGVVGAPGGEGGDAGFAFAVGQIGNGGDGGNGGNGGNGGRIFLVSAGGLVTGTIPTTPVFGLPGTGGVGGSGAVPGDDGSPGTQGAPGTLVITEDTDEDGSFRPRKRADYRVVSFKQAETAECVVDTAADVDGE